jgi:hypothetical protein
VDDEVGEALALDNRRGFDERRLLTFADTAQIHAPNSTGIDKPFRVFEGKYSILIDMRELEATMSGHPISTTAPGMHPLRAPHGSALGAVILRETICRLLPSEGISVLLMAQRPDKMATAA